MQELYKYVEEVNIDESNDCAPTSAWVPKSAVKLNNPRLAYSLLCKM